MIVELYFITDNWCQHGQHPEIGGNISTTLMVICCGAKEPLVKSFTIMEEPNLSQGQKTLKNTIIILDSILEIPAIHNGSFGQIWDKRLSQKYNCL